MILTQPGRGVGEAAGQGWRPSARLYVAVPGIRNYLEFGGHGCWSTTSTMATGSMKRIPTAGLDAKGVPNNVKGICAMR